MSTDLASKKRVRAGHRASTTRFLGQVDAATAASDVAKIIQLKRSLEDKLKSLNTLDEEILALTAEGDIEDEIVQADEVREQILYTALSRLELAPKTVPATGASTEKPSDSRVTLPPALPAGPATTEGTPSRRDSMTVDTAAGDGAHARGAKVRLPKITLPRFNGDPAKWTSFWDSYQSAIHLNSELTEVDKFNYLWCLLDHSAYEAIAGLTLSSANYQQAIEILRKRFGNKQVIISKHMDTLMIYGSHNFRPTTEGAASTVRPHRVPHTKFEVARH